MNNFEFRNPTKIIFGKGQIASIAKEIPTDAKVMVTYGGGSIKANGVYEQVMTALAKHDVVEFSGIEPNPKFPTLMKCVEKCKAENIDYLLPVGGGSTIDGTKFVAVAMNYDGDDAWDLVIKPKLALTLKATPLSAVLTLPATGSEMNNGAVVSRVDTAEKYPFFHPDNYPRFSVLDPETCFSLPARQVANGIVDTFIHTVEQYLTYPQNAMIQDRFSEGILLNLIEVAPKLKANQKDYDAMANFMWSATMGLNGLIGSGVMQDWATHMIGHELTALKGLDHAVTLACVYPAMLSVLRESKGDKIVQYAERVWQITEGTKEEIIDAAIAKTTEFFETVGINTKLSAHGVGQDTIDEIVSRFTARGAVFGEKRGVTPEVAGQILSLAL